MCKIPNLFTLMLERKVSQKQLSEAIGFSSGNISDWKTGRSSPGIDALLKIADYFNVSVDYLLGLDENSTAKGASNEQEERMLKAFRKLTYEDKLIEIGRIEGITEKYSPEQKENAEAKNAETA